MHPARCRHALVTSLAVACAVGLACRRGADRSQSGSASRTGAEGAPSGGTSSPETDAEPAYPAAGGELTGAAIEEIGYEVTGGIAGFRLHLRVERGGAALVYDGGELARSGQLTAEEWEELLGLVEAAELPQLPPRYGREGAVADAMQEVVTIRSGQRTVKVSATTDPNDEPPERFRALTRRLMELVHTLPAAH